MSHLGRRQPDSSSRPSPKVGATPSFSTVSASDKDIAAVINHQSAGFWSPLICAADFAIIIHKKSFA